MYVDEKIAVYIFQVHCYRAVLEKILVKHWPRLKHTLIKSVKHTADMSFTQ